MHDPSLSHKRPRFGCFCGTFSPSCRQIRSTALVVHDPASRRSQQRCDFPVAVAAVLPGELDDVGGQPFFVTLAPRPLALRRAMLSERPADPALRQSQLRPDMVDAGAATRGA